MDVIDVSLVAWRGDGGCHGMPMRPGLGAKHFVCGGIARREMEAIAEF